MKIISLIEEINVPQAPEIITKYTKSFDAEFNRRNTFCKYSVKNPPWELLSEQSKENNLLFLCHDHTGTAKIWTGLALNNWDIIIFDAHNDYDSNYTNPELKNWNFINHIEDRIKNGYVLGYHHFNSSMKYCPKLLYKYAFELNETTEIKKELLSYICNQRIYISIDLDVIDPVIFPDVDFPVPGGITYPELLFYLSVCILNSANTIIDISEFKPKPNDYYSLRYYKKLLEDIDLLFSLKKNTFNINRK